MDQRLARKIEPIRQWAEMFSWDTDTQEAMFDGAPGVQLVGTRTDRHPDADSGAQFGFSVAFAVNPDTGRVAAMRLDGNPRAAFIMVIEDGTNRYWYGPLSAAKRALEDPETWTGVVPPAPPEVES